MLATPLGQRPQRLALEVDDHEVGLGRHVQGLAEVEVAVMPDLRDTPQASQGSPDVGSLDGQGPAEGGTGGGDLMLHVLRPALKISRR